MCRMMFATMNEFVTRQRTDPLGALLSSSKSSELKHDFSDHMYMLGCVGRYEVDVECKFWS